MEIKEVETLLHVSRSNIRFYEKAGLLHPQRRDNKYRNYSSEDLAVLKKILILRKVGCSVEEIAAIQKQELSLPTALEASIARMEEELEQLQAALVLAKQLSEEQASYADLEQDSLWEEITSKERSGQKFVEICRDYLLFEAELLECLSVFRLLRQKFSLPIAVGIGLLLCVIRGLSGVLIWKDGFWEGFFYPIDLFLMASAVFLPVYALRRKRPKTASVYLNVLYWLAMGILGLIAAIFLLALLHTI